MDFSDLVALKIKELMKEKKYKFKSTFKINWNL